VPRLSALRDILSGKTPIGLHLEFLYMHNRADLQVRTSRLVARGRRNQQGITTNSSLVGVGALAARRQLVCHRHTRTRGVLRELSHSWPPLRAGHSQPQGGVMIMNPQHTARARAWAPVWAPAAAATPPPNRPTTSPRLSPTRS
jgi:hypothetical protein